jgi:sRNA-binding regulator protein Hfq
MSYEQERNNQNRDATRRATIHPKKDYKPRPQAQAKPRPPAKPTHEDILKEAMDSKKSIYINFIDADKWRAKIVRMDKFTITLNIETDDGVKVETPDWTIYKHAIKGFAVLENSENVSTH